ncbi:restriction endonuclease [Campylobacter sp. MIT 12-8780]|uniref:McrC family protein n=1 Tax=unclassified Campylobacter TaxID=2593542 RepID=UPI00115D347C|nr:MULTISPECIES: McrC family protein [unclassified Campylobacter]NDJ27310.1 McrC family protein [Campylobacter sp. MIT 19-121]TQR40361.1 restriction endonuclease [Campylobacter sp. MIT 12-8780]
MKTNNTLAITEWQRFGLDDIKAVLQNSANTDQEAKKIFNELQDFAKQKDSHNFINFCGSNKLKARNYVGLIQTQSGFCLEILPKIFRSEKKLEQDLENETSNSQDKAKALNSAKKAQDLLLDMLKTLKDSPFKQSNIATLKAKKLPLLEIFVSLFLDELEKLVKQGIKSDYIAYKQNRTFLRGKLLFNENLKYNFAHKERFYTFADEYSQNLPQNRLIVAALLKLQKLKFSSKISTRLLQFRFIFDDIAQSTNYKADFAKCVNSRHFKAYEQILPWCKLFLEKLTPSPYSGSSKASALLFDMNKLFESFVAFHLKKHCSLNAKDHAIKTQDSSKYLLERDAQSEQEQKNKFKIKPDIVICKKDENEKPIAILDTKWKILEKEEEINQGDLYQIFAYLCKYENQKGVLIYPKISGEIIEKLHEHKYQYRAFKDTNIQKELKIYFFDLEGEISGIKNLFE